MFDRLVRRPLTAWTTAVAARRRQLHEQPDAGMETADKILWAAVITIVVGGVGLIFKNKLEAFAEGLSVTLGW